MTLSRLELRFAPLKMFLNLNKQGVTGKDGKDGFVRPGWSLRPMVSCLFWLLTFPNASRPLAVGLPRGGDRFMVLVVEGKRLVNDRVLNMLFKGGGALLPGGLGSSWDGGPFFMLRA